MVGKGVTEPRDIDSFLEQQNTFRLLDEVLKYLKRNRHFTVDRVNI